MEAYVSDRNLRAVKACISSRQTQLHSLPKPPEQPIGTTEIVPAGYCSEGTTTCFSENRKKKFGSNFGKQKGKHLGLRTHGKLTNTVSCIGGLSPVPDFTE